MKKVEIILSAVDKTSAAMASVKRGLDAIQPAAAIASAALSRFGIGLPVTMAATALSALNVASNTAAAAREIKNFSTLSGTTAEQFQAMAYASDRFGVGQEKLADIFKDVQDKVGDFIQNGGGPLKDFFDNIAPRVGVTAEQFRRLSGPEALQLYVSSLEKANLSQSDLVFYMEAIASDASRLLPLLRNNGAEFARLGDEGRALGVVMDDISVNKAVEFGDNLKKLQGMAKSLSMDIGNALIPTINRLAEEFIDARKAGLGMGEMLNSIWRTTPQDAGKQVAEIRAEIEGLNADLARYQKFGGDTSAIDTALASANRRLEYFKMRQRAEALALGEGAYSNEGRSKMPATPVLSSTGGGKSKATKPAAYTDPLAEEAKAYAQAMQQIHQAQVAAATSGMELTATQQRLVDLVNDPAFANWPESWQLTTLEAAKFVISAEQAAAQQKRLNELLGETDSSKLALARADMQLLASAFESGQISEEKYIEATRARLGEFQGGVDDSFQRAGEHAQNFFSGLAGALTSFNDDVGESFSRTILQMLQNILRLEAEMAMMAAWKGAGGDKSGGIGGMIGKAIIGLIGGGAGVDSSFTNLGNMSNAAFMPSYEAMSFAGGGSTGSGPRSGGLDGQGGFWAIMHPQETVYDHARGQFPAASSGAPPVVNLTIQALGNPQVQRQQSRREQERWVVDLVVADVAMNGEITSAMRGAGLISNRGGT